MYIESTPLNSKGKGFQGASLYNAENPQVGAVFTYYLKDRLATIKDRRQKNEAEMLKNNHVISYPSPDSIRAEDREDQPYLLFTVRDKDGKVVRRLKAGNSSGVHRINWDFRYPSSAPVNFDAFDPDNIYIQQPIGSLALPGQYSVGMSKVENGKETILTEPVNFNLVTLNNSTLPIANRQNLEVFYQKIASLQRAVSGTADYMNDMQRRLKYIHSAILNSTLSDVKDLQTLRHIEDTLAVLNQSMFGDRSLAAREFAVVPGLLGRVENIVYGLWYTTQSETGTMEQTYEITANKFGHLLESTKKLDKQLTSLEQKLEKAGAPYTPGRLPVWQND
jgi:hypothetical protein